MKRSIDSRESSAVAVAKQIARVIAKWHHAFHEPVSQESTRGETPLQDKLRERLHSVTPP